MKTSTAAMAILLAATPGLAHDTWLLAQRADLKPGDSLTLELTSAMDFPRPETAVMAERLVASRLRLARVTHVLDAKAGEKALLLSSAVPTPGVAVAWIETRPRILELKPDQVVHYLEEIGALDSIGASWRRSGKKVWRESYVKLAKAYARVGEPTGDRSWAEPLGLALELAPEADPTALPAGDALGVRLLWQGKPLPDLAVGVVAEGAGKALMLRTDRDGRVSFAVDRPGRWMVRATYLRQATAADREWDSVFSTLTFAARAK